MAQGGEGGLPPELEKILKNITKGFKGGRLNILFVILAIVAIWIVFSCAYTVGVDEVGIIQRFGKYAKTTTPGLHFKLPWGIANLTKVKVKEFASGKQYEREYLMLTGDLNCAVVPWIVQFRIDDPYEFLFKIRNVRTTLRDMSESIVRQIVGDRSINEVISKRKEIADEVKIRLQQVLTESETGIKLVNVELKKTNVPEPVQASFNEVNQAVQEKERLIYQAREEYNKIIPKARGEAEQTIKQGETG